MYLEFHPVESSGHEDEVLVSFMAATVGDHTVLVAYDAEECRPVSMVAFKPRLVPSIEMESKQMADVQRVKIIEEPGPYGDVFRLVQDFDSEEALQAEMNNRLPPGCIRVRSVVERHFAGNESAPNADGLDDRGVLS